MKDYKNIKEKVLNEEKITYKAKVTWSFCVNNKS